MLLTNKTFALLQILQLIALFSFASSKHIDHVFNRVKVITGYEDDDDEPYDYFRVNVTWGFTYCENVEIGDTFSLNMPYVFGVNAIDDSGAYTQKFDIKLSDDTVIASCDIDGAFGRKKSTTINCEVQYELQTHRGLQGWLEFPVNFEGGGRVETILEADHWKPGSNVITFNDELSTIVKFHMENHAKQREEIYRHTYDDELFFYYAAPKDMCYHSGGYKAIESGDLGISITPSEYEYDTIEAYHTRNFSRFSYPEGYEDFNDYHLHKFENGMHIIFGEMRGNERIWISGYVHGQLKPGTPLAVHTGVNLLCVDGTWDNDTSKDVYFLRGYPALSGGRNKCEYPDLVL